MSKEFDSTEQFVKWWDSQRPKGTNQTGFAISKRAWEAGRALGRREMKEELKRAAEHIDNTVRYPSDAYEALTNAIEAIPEEGV